MLTVFPGCWVNLLISVKAVIGFKYLLWELAYKYLVLYSFLKMDNSVKREYSTKLITLFVTSFCLSPTPNLCQWWLYSCINPQFRSSPTETNES